MHAHRIHLASFVDQFEGCACWELKSTPDRPSTLSLVVSIIAEGSDQDEEPKRTSIRKPLGRTVLRLIRENPYWTKQFFSFPLRDQKREIPKTHFTLGLEFCRCFLSRLKNILLFIPSTLKHAWCDFDWCYVRLDRCKKLKKRNIPASDCWLILQ